MKPKCSLRKINEQIKAKIILHCEDKRAQNTKSSKPERLAKLFIAAVATHTPPSPVLSSLTPHKNFTKLRECLKGKKSLLRKHFLTAKCCYSTCPFHSLVEAEQQLVACMFLFPVLSVCTSCLPKINTIPQPYMCNSLLVLLSPLQQCCFSRRPVTIFFRTHYAYNPAESGMPSTSIFFSGQK